MGLFNDILHATGVRSTSDWCNHNAYERGDITRQTLSDSINDNYRSECRESEKSPCPGDSIYRGVRRIIR